MNEEKDEKKLQRMYDKFVKAMTENKISFSMRCQIQAEFDKKMYADYMEECKVSSVEQIDWNNPVVAVCHLLNDPLNNHYIMHGSPLQKQSVYDQMTPEMLETYWTYTDKNGYRFCDKENKDRIRQAKKQFKQLKK